MSEIYAITQMSTMQLIGLAVCAIAFFVILWPDNEIKNDER